MVTTSSVTMVLLGVLPSAVPNHAVHVEQKHGVNVPSQPCFLGCAGSQLREHRQRHLAKITKHSASPILGESETPRAKAMPHDGFHEMAPGSVDDCPGGGVTLAKTSLLIARPGTTRDLVVNHPFGADAGDGMALNSTDSEDLSIASKLNLEPNISLFED